jgi:hypothetical protein
VRLGSTGVPFYRVIGCLSQTKHRCSASHPPATLCSVQYRLHLDPDRPTLHDALLGIEPRKKNIQICNEVTDEGYCVIPVQFRQTRTKLSVFCLFLDLCLCSIISTPKMEALHYSDTYLNYRFEQRLIP